MSIKALFHRRDLIKSGDCLLWPEHELNNRGYGVIRVRKGGSVKRFMAHRVSYSIHVGDIPIGMVVMHICNNRRCVNPDHLLVGTQDENEKHKVASGRSNRGEDRWSAKLTNNQAQEILNRLRTGDKVRDLAVEFNVSQGIIYSIRSRRRWKHLI